MADCKWCKDEFCTNPNSPMRGDYCPVSEFPDVCKWENRVEAKKEMNLKQAINKLEAEYERAKKLDFVRNPIAWALYQVWKMADERR